MAYEKRKSGPYYYQKKWVDGKCVSIYLGKGPEAEAARARIQKTKQNRAERDEGRATHAPLDLLGTANDRLIHLSYLAHGFHYTKGKWRKRNRRTLDDLAIAEIQHYHTIYQGLNAVLRERRQAQIHSEDESNYGVTVCSSTQNPAPQTPIRRPRDSARRHRLRACLIASSTPRVSSEESTITPTLNPDQASPVGLVKPVDQANCRML